MTEIFKNLVHGMGSVLDINPAPVDSFIIEPDLETDADKVAQDWQNVGCDLSSALKKYGENAPQE